MSYHSEANCNNIEQALYDLCNAQSGPGFREALVRAHRVLKLLPDPEAYAVRLAGADGFLEAVIHG